MAAASLFAGTQGMRADDLGVSRNRNEAFFAVHRLPDACGFAVIGTPWFATGGYTYLNKPIPLYYSVYDEVVLGNGMKVVLHGKTIEQYQGDEILNHTDRFNYALLLRGQSIPDYQTVACFENKSGGGPVCLQRRAGICR